MQVDFFYPFDSVDGDRKVLAATERRFWGALFNDGVVGSGGFPISDNGGGSFTIGQGVAVIGGVVGGITTAKTITANPAAGSSVYIALRASTLYNTRDVQLVAVSTLEDDTAEQLEAGGVRDLMLYKVTGQTGGGYGLLDERAYCTSFDAQQWAQVLNDTVAGIEDQGTEQLNAMRSLFEAATDAANAETAGMFGAAGRQGFMNPQFLVNQRGQEAYSLTSGSAYTFDRWKVSITGRVLSSAMTLRTEQHGARHALRIDVKPFASGAEVARRVGLVQNIEGGVRTFAAGGKQFTVSFDAKAAKACRLGVDANQIAESGSTGVEVTKTITLGTEWTRYNVTLTGNVDLAAGQVNDVLRIGFHFLFAGYTRYGADQNDANTIWFANMQINEGNKALACYARPYAEELEACQRYYVALGMVSLATGAPLAGSNQVITCPVPITRRFYRVPDVSSTDRVEVAGKASAEVAAGGWRHGLAWALSSNSVDAPVFVVTNTDASAVTRVCFDSLAFDAEITD